VRRLVLKVIIPFYRFDLWRRVQTLENTELLRQLELFLTIAEDIQNKQEEEFYSRRLKEVDEFLEESRREVERLSSLLEEYEKDRNIVLERLGKYGSILKHKDRGS